MWVARDKDGDLWLNRWKPESTEVYNQNYYSVEIDEDEVPYYKNLKYGDEPIEVDIFPKDMYINLQTANVALQADLCMAEKIDEDELEHLSTFYKECHLIDGRENNGIKEAYIAGYRKAKGK